MRLSPAPGRAGAWFGARVAARTVGRAATWMCIGAVTACAAGSPDAITLPAPAGPGADPVPVSSAADDTVQRQPAPGSCHARGTGLYTLPDARCTPGAVSPAVTQGNIGSTICRSGYTRRVRPPERITEAEKQQSMAAYGDRGPASAYEYDHLVPLELGGATNDPRNLWPEPGRTPNPKDELERRLNRLVCQRRLSLARARVAIAGDWIRLARPEPSR